MTLGSFFELTIYQEARKTKPYRKMRILHFTGEFPPHVSGGLATYVYEVTTRLANVGHTVDVALVKGDSDYYRSLEPVDGDVDLSVIDFDPEEIDALSATMLDIDAVQAAVGNVDLGTTDLVHVHDWYGVFGALAATADSNVPIIVSSHLPTSRHSGSESPTAS